MKIYMLSVKPLYEEDGPEKVFGIYSSQKKAEKAQAIYMEGLEKDAGKKLNKDYFTLIEDVTLDEEII